MATEPLDALPKRFLDQLAQRLPDRSRAALLVLHLAESCPECRAVVETWTPDESGEEPAFRLAAALLGTEPEPADLRRAETEADHLLALPAEERERALGRSWSRFRSRVLLAVLLTRSQSGDLAPERASEVARVAAEVGHAMARPDLEALSLGYAANALRAAGRLDAAGRLFARASRRLALDPEPGLWVRARFESLLGSLLKDQRDLDAARVALLNARAMFRACRDSNQEASAGLKLAIAHRLAHEPAAAIRVIQEALDVIDPWREPRLHLAALHNLARYLAESGHAGFARHLLDLLAPLYTLFPAFEVRRSWLAGIVARELGEPEAAERHLHAALARFVDAGAALLAAFVALDLAELLLSVGRSTEVAAITRDLPALFRSQEAYPAAAVGVLLFHRAAVRNEVEQLHVDALRRLLDRVRPGCCAQPPPVRRARDGER